MRIRIESLLLVFTIILMIILYLYVTDQPKSTINRVDSITNNTSINNIHNDTNQNKTHSSNIELTLISIGDEYPIINNMVVIMVGIKSNASYIRLTNISNCPYEIYDTIGQKVTYSTIHLPTTIMIKLNVTNRSSCDIKIGSHIIKLRRENNKMEVYQ